MKKSISLIVVILILVAGVAWAGYYKVEWIERLITLGIIAYLIIREISSSKTAKEAVDRTISSHKAEISQKESHIQQLKDHIQQLKDLYDPDKVDKMMKTLMNGSNELDKSNKDMQFELKKVKDELHQTVGERDKLKVLGDTKSLRITELNQRIAELQQMENAFGHVSTIIGVTMASLESFKTETSGMAGTLNLRKRTKDGGYIGLDKDGGIRLLKDDSPLARGLRKESEKQPKEETPLSRELRKGREKKSEDKDGDK